MRCWVFSCCHLITCTDTADWHLLAAAAADNDDDDDDDDDGKCEFSVQ